MSRKPPTVVFGASPYSPEHKLYILSCFRFRWLVLKALKAKGLIPPAKRERTSPEWRRFAETAAVARGDQKRNFFRFLNCEIDITPESVVYFRLCRVLGIDPGKACFRFFIKDGANLEKI